MGFAIIIYIYKTRAFDICRVKSSGDSNIVNVY